jgi:hypothetical protein
MLLDHTGVTVNGVSARERERERERYSSLTFEKEFRCQQKRTHASSRVRMRLSVRATWRRLPR